MKRLFHNVGNVFASLANEPEIQETNHRDHGCELRKFLWLSHLTSKKVDATFLAQLSYHITQAGGVGVEDLAMTPESKHGSEHIRLLLGQEFEDPELYYVKTPMYDKIVAERKEVSMPIHLPSTIFKEHFKSAAEPSEGEEEPVLEHLDCHKWSDHPVRNRHKDRLHWSRIVPAAMYWDGVQYTIRDNFFAIYLRDLREGISHVLVVVSGGLSPK